MPVFLMNNPISSVPGSPVNQSAPAPAGWVPVAGLTLAKLTTLLFDVSRWRILRELAKGEALPVMELVRRTRRTRNSVQKNMAILKDAKLVVQTYGHLYRLAPQFAASDDGTRLDLGYCVLCLDRLPT